MRILAIDPGTLCGWAITDQESGVWNLRPARDEGQGKRYLLFERKFAAAVNADVDLVVYEDVKRHSGTQAAHVYGGLVAILQKVCEQHGVPYKGIGVSTIKKHATGKGNAKKGAMVQAARRKWGTLVREDNHADALWIMDLAYKMEMEIEQ